MSVCVQNKDSREMFVRTSVAFLRTRTFDGLDLHFEYPGTRGSPTADKVRFARLCKVHQVAGQHGASARDIWVATSVNRIT